VDAEPLIQVVDLCRVFEVGEVAVHALRDVSIDIHANEFVAVMGASGSGKSTFMSIVGCLDRPTSGTYHFAGKNVADFSRDDLATIRNRELGFVFQAFNLIPRLTALENVELPLFYGDDPLREQRDRALEALAAVNLSDRAEHFPNQLSGGQQQRVAIARALINRPNLILADEPTGNLDTPTGLEIMNLLSRLHREQGITIVLVTHEAELAAFAERVVQFRDGRICSDQRRSASAPDPLTHRASASP
jgi:ABC-type lipoprotein export system ATPase subunit